MNEFKLIEKYFLSGGDDAALVKTDPSQEIVIAVDTLLAGRHFFETDMPSVIAHKALAANLSDMAAMGAKPFGFLLAITLPQIDERWLENFSQGLKKLSEQHAVKLIGGDTTKGPLSISITILGNVPKGKALTRQGAKPGDGIFVSGQLGAAAMFIKSHRHKLNVSISELDEALPIYQYPQPQISLALTLRDIATSCIDVSDGLAQDCQHILKQSNVGAHIDVEKIPVHPCVLRSMPLQQAQQLALTGGDDYQLLFTAPADANINSDVKVTRIGTITPGHSLQLFNHGEEIDWDLQGWDHFQSEEHE